MKLLIHDIFQRMVEIEKKSLNKTIAFILSEEFIININIININNKCREKAINTYSIDDTQTVYEFEDLSGIFICTPLSNYNGALYIGDRMSKDIEFKKVFSIPRR